MAAFLKTLATVRRMLGAVAIATVASLTSPAEAQVSNLKVQISNDWVAHPAFDGSRLVGYLAEQVTGTPAPNGFTLVWFERLQSDPFGTDGFTMEGYTGSSLTEAAHKIWLRLANPDAFVYTEFAGDLPAAGTLEVEDGFVQMQYGLAVTDPLQPWAHVLTAADMEVSVELGAQGASELSALAVVTPGTCESQTVADGEVIEVILLSQTLQLERIVAQVMNEGGSGSNGANNLFLPWTYCYSTVIQTGGWGVSGPGVADAAGNCSYTRTYVVQEDCCRQYAFCTWCWSTTTTMTQTGSCPGNVPDGNCSNRPGCTLPPPPQ